MDSGGRRGLLVSGAHRVTQVFAASGRRFVPAALLGTLVIVTVAAGLVAVSAAGPVAQAAHAPSRHHGATAFRAEDAGNRLVGLGKKTVVLPAATVAPAAAPAALIDAPPIAPREDFAFAPYWTLPQSGGFSLSGLTTLAYFSIGVNPDGSLVESGPGWNGYESQDLADLITRAHASGERVVLTVNDFDQGSLNALTSSATAPHTLAAALIPVLTAKNLDGVNFDFEGMGNGDQAGLTNLITLVSASLRAADPHWQITMDTYASSAADPDGFYDIPALSDAVDAFFVMAYELNLQGSSSPISPLTSGQFSDLSTLQQYTAVVAPSKVILGSPFFGIDWPTDNGTMQATSTGAANDLADSQIQNSGNPAYWDPVTDTGWTSYQVGTQWHESFWESPYGLYMVAQLAAGYGIRGVGIWALGMESDDTAMISALDGVAPAGGPGAGGPQSNTASTTTTAPGGSPTTSTSPSTTTTTGTGTGTTTTTTPGSTTTSTTTTTAPPVATGTADGEQRDLTPVATTSVVGLAIGTLTGFATSDPAYACLVGGPALDYYLASNLTEYVVVASAPTDCVSQEFTFPN
jgi:glycosyl hydrolase family 18 (putative chitinase)